MRDVSWMVQRAKAIVPRVAPVTLLHRGVDDQFKNQRYEAYVHPPATKTGLETANKNPVEEAVIVLFQEGQSRAPDADDVIREDTGNFDPGGDWVVATVESSLRSRTNWGVHHCTCRRTPYRPS